MGSSHEPASAVVTKRMRHEIRGIQMASRRRVAFRRCLSAAAGAALSLVACGHASSQTLSDALVRVYQTNPQLNAQRAQLRVTDESVPQALSGYRPQVSAGLSGGINPVTTVLADGSIMSATLRPWIAGVTITQPLFNGFKTASSVRQAESQVRSGREALRMVEQNVFVLAVTAYMNVVADQALVEAPGMGCARPMGDDTSSSAGSRAAFAPAEFR